MCVCVRVCVCACVCVCVCVRWECYLCSLAHLKVGADGVEGPGATDVQVGVVEGLQHPHVVRALLLEGRNNNISI